MNEKTKADIYITYLDQILAGETGIGPVEDVEITKLLLLAKTIIATDFSVNSQMRENLRKQLLAQVRKESSLSVPLRNDDELDEEALNEVTAAGQAGEQMLSCPYCGSRYKIIEGKCPACNH